MESPLNIIYLHSHDTGRYIQPYGYGLFTPNLQSLAEQGVLFRSSFSVSPTCSPSRSGLLTGLYPHTSGMTGLAHRGWEMNDYHKHINHLLRRKNYNSALFGIQHITSGKKIDRLGYDLAKPGSSGEEITQNAIEFLRGSPDQPFFTSIGYWETHRPFPLPSEKEQNPGQDWRYNLPPQPVRDSQSNRLDMAAYATAVQKLDEYYGRVIKALDESGLRERTLVICTTDHGIAFPGMKCTLTDHGIGVLLIFSGPPPFSGGRVVDAMVTHLDILPTICDLLDVKPDLDLPGKSVLPLVLEHVDSIHERIYAEVNYHAAYEPLRCVRTERYKYIKRFDGRDKPVLVNCDDSLSKDDLLQAGWQEHAIAEEYLFDLTFDPNEACNLAKEPSYQDVLKELRQDLLVWMETNDDPLLKGPLSPPPGTQINDPDGLSPEEPTITIK